MKVLLSRFNKGNINYESIITSDIIKAFIDVFENHKEVFNEISLKDYGIENEKELGEYYFKDNENVFIHDDYFIEMSNYMELYTIHKRGTKFIYVIDDFNDKTGHYDHVKPKLLKTLPSFVNAIDKLGFDETLRFCVAEVPDEYGYNFRYCTDDFNNQWIEPNNRIFYDYRDERNENE